MTKRHATRPRSSRGASSSQKRATAQAMPAYVAQDSKNNPQFAGSITYSNMPEPHMLPRNYKAYAREGYRQDPTLYKAVQYLITNGAAIPPVLFTDSTCKTRIEQHPLLDKLEHPNPEQSGVDYRESAFGHLLIAGNSFQLALRAGKSGPPDELWTLPPDMVHPLTQKPRGIVGYHFDGYDDTNNPIPPEQIRHDKFWSPDDPVFGLSPVEPAAILIDQNMAARKWNLSVLQNSGRMDGAWVAPTPMSPNDRKKLQDQLNGKYRGFQNAGKSPVLDAGMKWEPTGYKPTEMDFLEAIRRNEGGIANVVNMPPQLIGDTSASTYNNMGEAKGASYTEGIFPILDRIYAGWRHWLVPMYPDLCDKNGRPTAYLYYDKETVEVVRQIVQARVAAQIEQATKVYQAGGMDMYTYQEQCGLLPDPNARGIYRVYNILVSSDKLQEYAAQAIKTPAAPPMPLPEPLNGPEPGGNANTNAPDDEGDGVHKKPAQGGKAIFTAAEKAALVAFRAQLRSAKRLAPATHKTWECAPGACAFCLQNDGVTVPVNEDFPNGCNTPDDCHKFCKCSAWELALPDDLDPAEYSPSFLIRVYALRFIEGRHDRDIAARDAQQSQDEESDDYTPDELDYAKTTRIEALRERKRKREEYRKFMEQVL